MRATSFAGFPIHALMGLTARPDLVFVEGRGSWLVDHAGKRSLDFLQGWAVSCLGHCPDVVDYARDRLAEHPAGRVRGGS